MPYRSWLFIAALGLTLSPTLLKAQNEATNGQDRASEQQQAAQELPIPLPVQIIEDDESADARQRSEADARQREIDDLEAQQGMNEATQAMNEATQSMNRAAWVSAFFVALGTGLLVWTLSLTRQANRAAVSAANAANETNRIAREDRRAWVNIRLLPYRAIEARDSGGFYSQVTVLLDNTGKSVASDMFVAIRPYIMDHSPSTQREDAFDWLSSRMNMRHELERGRTVFPGESISFEPDLAMTAAEIDVSRRFILRVAALVRYRTAEV